MRIVTSGSTARRSLHERIQHPENETNMVDVINDIKNEESVARHFINMGKRIHVEPDPCPANSGGPHYWRYPAAGRSGRRQCLHGCGRK